MGTKNNPGRFDCYANADRDEPMFVLLGRDVHAHSAVRKWSDDREHLINVGMNIGLLPVTGIPLPFVSAGGSSLVVSLLCLGMAQNVSLQSKALRF